MTLIRALINCIAEMDGDGEIYFYTEFKTL
jgi:hypothetical protein